MKRGFSLTELLIVIAIIAIIAALLFPVLMSAKSKSKEVPCITNLRQVHVAVALYMEGNNDILPPGIDSLIKVTPTVAAVVQCPGDATRGANQHLTDRLAQKTSTFFVRNDDGLREALLAADPNHGIAYCVVHGQRIDSTLDFVPERDTTGLVLRLRRDGSVQHAQVGKWCGPQVGNARMEGRQHWSLLSDIKCVEPYCDGLIAPCR